MKVYKDFREYPNVSYCQNIDECNEWYEWQRLSPEQKKGYYDYQKQLQYAFDHPRHKEPHGVGITLIIIIATTILGTLAYTWLHSIPLILLGIGYLLIKGGELLVCGLVVMALIKFVFGD